MVHVFLLANTPTEPSNYDTMHPHLPQLLSTEAAYQERQRGGRREFIVVFFHLGGKEEKQG